MTTNGLHIPDEDKVAILEGEEADDVTWIELTNHRGRDPEEDIKEMEEILYE